MHLKRASAAVQLYKFSGEVSQFFNVSRFLIKTLIVIPCQLGLVTVHPVNIIK